MWRERIKIELLIHDLKVPLAVIEAGIVSLLKKPEKHGCLTEKQEKVLMRALRNTKISKMIVDDALELAKSTEGIASLTKFRLSDLIEQSLVEVFDLADCNASEKIRSYTRLPQLRDALRAKGLLLAIDEKLWCQDVCLDAAKTKQILRNLLNNALKYRKSRVELAIEKKEGYIVFSVKDDGEGIPAAHHKKIFDSYFQMDGTESYTIRGHGLGLAGVMILLEDMGGKLSLESDEGEGAKFLVKLPLMVS